MGTPILTLPNLIGLCGDAGAGKDTLAKGIRQSFPEYQLVKFAAPLKAMLSYLMAEPVDMWEDREWKERPHARLEGRTPRYAAQTLGTEWGRDLIGEDFWVNTAMRQAQRLGDRLIFTDVRYPNEADAVRKAGGVVVRVVREGVALPDNFRHPSESHKGIHDAVVNNWYADAEEFMKLGPFQLGGVLKALFGGSMVPGKHRF